MQLHSLTKAVRDIEVPVTSPPSALNVQVLWRAESHVEWKLLGDDKVTVVHEDGKFFFRASIDHFSQGCLAKNVDMNSPYYEEVESSWFRTPKKRQVEFMNATERTLVFLVLPTSSSISGIRSVKAALAAYGAGMNVEVRKAFEKRLFPAATDAQVLQLPGWSSQDEPLPHITCSFSSRTGCEARVMLITTDDSTVHVWDSRIVKGRTRVTVLPGQFSNGMRAIHGIYKGDVNDFLQVILTGEPKKLDRVRSVPTEATIFSYLTKYFWPSSRPNWS